MCCCVYPHLDYTSNATQPISSRLDSRVRLQVQGASRGLIGHFHGAFLGHALASQAGGSFFNFMTLFIAADMFIQVRNIEHQRNLAPTTWWKRSWNSFWRFLNSPSENMMELLPSLDENDIISIKTNALGAVSPAHMRFLESEHVPGDDSFVPMSEDAIPNLCSDVPPLARSLQSPKTSRSSAAIEKTNFASATSLNSRPAVPHSQPLSNSSSSPDRKLSKRTSNPNSSTVLVTQEVLSSLLAIARAPLDEPEILVPGSMYNSKTMMKWRNYLHQLAIMKAQAEYDAAADLADLEECECTDSLSSDESASRFSIDVPQSQAAAEAIPVTSKGQRTIGHSDLIPASLGHHHPRISRPDNELHDAASSDDDWGPPPPIPDDVWGSEDEADRGPPPAYDDMAMIIDDSFEIEQSDATRYGMAAAVEKDPAAECTEEELRLRGENLAEQRAKKAAARAALLCD